MSYPDFQAMLRADALEMAMAVILVSAGLAAILFFSMRVLKRDHTLPLFGIFSTLYGVRLFFSPTALVVRRTPLVLLGVSPGLIGHLVRDITFLLPLFGFLFCVQILGHDLRRRWLVRVLLVYAPLALAAVGLIADAAYWHMLDTPAHENHAHVLMQTLLNILGLYSAAIVTLVDSFLISDIVVRGRKVQLEMRVFALGFTVMGALLVHGNLTFFGVPGPNLEPVGFFIFIWVLAYVVMLRGIRNEEQLLAVRNELEIARQIQSSILPPDFPQVAGAEVAVCYAPMKAIGGDFYEFLRVDDERLGILIADVSGHGVPAAMMASMVKVAVFAQMENAARPSQLLAGLNKVLCGNLRGQYVTAAYIFLDAGNKKLACAGAGHPLPLLWDGSTRTARYLGDNGLLMGVFPDAEYQTTELAWNPGDRCLLYTDGVTEAENAAEVSYGTERLEELMTAADAGTPRALSERLLESVVAWRGRGREDAQDDITIIAVEFPAAQAAQVGG